MMDCDFVEHDGKFRCTRCGMVVPRPGRMNCRQQGWVEAPVMASTAPNTLQRVGHYAGAVAAWIKAGCPERSDEEVAQIYSVHCEPCEHRDPVRNICKTCGCNITGEESGIKKFLKKLGAGGLVNKIRMATEKCPRGKW